MIIYADPNYQTDVSGLLVQLTVALERARNHTRVEWDDLRYLLILAGQAEQAVYDGLPGDVYLNKNKEELKEWLEAFSKITSLAAHAFYKCWEKAGQAALLTAGSQELHLIKDLLENLQQKRPVAAALTVKIPEGYAFYALYPEQYCFAARQWLAAHEQPQRDRVAVIGIRSIGTSLAALVCAALEQAGWPAHSFTVRPGGHPYRRELEINPTLLKKAATAIVVDEGPGQSGSSMAAVAFALEQHGLKMDRIAFMPGHHGEPGSAASEEVRACWSAVPRYVIPPSQLTIAGRSLPSLLSEQAGLMLKGALEHSVQVEDIGWGKWRDKVFANPGKWPPVYPAFELPKYLASTSKGPALVMKFYGLCAFSAHDGSIAETAHTRLTQRAKAGYGPSSPGYSQGFVAYEWVNGSPLTCKDVDEAVLVHLGRYIAVVSGPTMQQAELGPAFERLQEMLYWNTWEILGEAAARASRSLAQRAKIKKLEINCYGDGNLAPHEWLRTPDGSLVKVNGAGLVTSHTCAGQQPLYWDLAGAIIEWQLTPTNRNYLLSQYEEFSGQIVQPPALNFYCAAYIAFKAGKTHLCALQAGDETEQARLWSDFEVLKAGLAACLAS